MLLSGSGKGQPGAVPGWVGYALLPVLNLVAAFVLSGLVILVIGENPVDVLSLLLATPFITPTTTSSPGWRSPSPSIAGCSTSAARGRPISAASAPGWWRWR